MSVEDYMRGREKARLTKDGVSPQWMKSPATVLNLTNKAFTIYYDAWQGAKNAPQNIKTKIETDLTEAARKGVGYGLFLGDLEACFKHIYNNNGSWNHDSGSNYYGPQVNGAINLPDGITSFLNAVDKRGEALKSGYVQYTNYVKQLAEAKKNNRWDDIGDYVEKIERTLWWGTPFTWVSSLDLSSGIAGYHERFNKWNSGLSLVHSFLKTYNDYNVGVGTSKPQAAAVAALSIILKNFVPIVGDAYAKVFEVLPGAIKWARGVRQEQDNQIRAILGARNWQA